MSSKDEQFMREAIALAKQAEHNNEVPVGALVVYNDEIVGRGANGPISLNDPSAHAEVIALRDAAKHMKNYRIPGTTLYVTIEPCTMCVGAIIHSRVSRVVYGATEPKAGMLESNPCLIKAGHFNHEIEVQSGVLADECSALISGFFAKRRALKAQLKKASKES